MNLQIYDGSNKICTYPQTVNPRASNSRAKMFFNSFPLKLVPIFPGTSTDIYSSLPNNRVEHAPVIFKKFHSTRSY